MPTTIDLVYKVEDLEIFNNVDTINLYPNTSFNNVVGKAVFNYNLINNNFNGTNFQTLYIDNVTFFLNIKTDIDNNTDSIFFTVSLYNNSNGRYILPDKLYTFQILGGSGKYNGATGNVYLYADINGTRYVKIILN
jgi:hypothetical protein